MKKKFLVRNNWNHMLMPPPIGVGGIKFYGRPSVWLYVHVHFRPLKLSNYLQKWFEIWYAALPLWIVSCVPLSWNFLFTELKFSLFIWKVFVSWNSTTAHGICFRFGIQLNHHEFLCVYKFYWSHLFVYLLKI